MRAWSSVHKLARTRSSGGFLQVPRGEKTHTHKHTLDWLLLAVSYCLVLVVISRIVHASGTRALPVLSLSCLYLPASSGRVTISITHNSSHYLKSSFSFSLMPSPLPSPALLNCSIFSSTILHLILFVIQFFLLVFDHRNTSVLVRKL